MNVPDIPTLDKLLSDSVGADVMIADRQTLASQSAVATEDITQLAGRYQLI